MKSKENRAEWDLFENLDEDLPSPSQQCTFDGKSLGAGVCYGCGHVVFAGADNVHISYLESFL